MDQHEEACESLQKAVEIKPDYADAWSNLGDALKNLGRSAEPVVAIRRALSLKPDAAGPANNLGLALDTRAGRRKRSKLSAAPSPATQTTPRNTITSATC